MSRLALRPPSSLRTPAGATLVFAMLLAPGLARGATFTVNATADTVDVGGCTAGHCSLREAAAAADADALVDVIDFAVAAPVELAAELEILEPVTIDGGGSATIVPVGPDNCQPWLLLRGAGSTVQDLRFDGLGNVCRGITFLPTGAGPATMRGTEIRGTTVLATQTRGTDGAVYENNDLSDNPGASGVFIQESTNSRLAANVFERNGDGINVLLSADTLVESNTVRDNAIEGIRIRAGSDRSIVRGNLVRGNGAFAFTHAGIAAGGATDVTIEGNDIRDNRGAGIFVTDFQFAAATNGLLITDNDVSGNVEGVQLFPFFSPISGTTVAGNRFDDQLGNGVLSFGLLGSHDSTTVEDNRIDGTGASGVAFIGGATDLAIRRNRIENTAAVAIFVAANFDQGNDGVDRVEGDLTDVEVVENEVSHSGNAGLFVTGVRVDDLPGGQNRIVDNRVHKNTSTGIGVANSSDVRIADNVVTAGGSTGISILQDSQRILVEDNLVGTDRAGATTDVFGDPLGNVLGIYLGFATDPNNFNYPVDLQGLAGPTDVRIANNVVTGSLSTGVLLGSDMDADILAYCATRACAGYDPAQYASTDGSAAAILVKNRIFDNGGLAVDRTATPSVAPGGVLFTSVGDGVTPNGSGIGANFGASFPVLDEVRFGPGRKVEITGTLDAVPNTPYAVEIFASAVSDPSGHGEAEARLGVAEVLTDGAGHASFVLRTSARALEHRAPFGAGGDTFLAPAASELACGTDLEVCTSGRTSELGANCVLSLTDLATRTTVSCGGP